MKWAFPGAELFLQILSRGQLFQKHLLLPLGKIAKTTREKWEG
jgi:hypothetical protein